MTTQTAAKLRAELSDLIQSWLAADLSRLTPYHCGYSDARLDAAVQAAGVRIGDVLGVTGGDDIVYEAICDVRRDAGEWARLNDRVRDAFNAAGAGESYGQFIARMGKLVEPSDPVQYVALLHDFGVTPTAEELDDAAERERLDAQEGNQ